MSASEQQRAEWLDAGFSERLGRLEGLHRRAEAQHEVARRGLERLTADQVEGLQLAWRRYCQVITELDRACAEFEALLGQ